LYRDGSTLSVLDAETLTLNDYSITPGQTYNYSIDAFDEAGNRSPSSSPVSVTVTAEDLEAPSIPLGLTATAVSQTQIDLSWEASSDNVEVVGYTLYRDGLSLANVTSPTLTFQVTDALPNSTYTFQIEAYDQAGNVSGFSDPVLVTTPDLPTSLTFETTADSYVNEVLFDSNFGTATSLRVDASPILNSFLRFSVQGLYGKSISSVLLLVYANSSSGNGVEVLTVSDNQWTENSINFTNAPQMGSVIATSPTVSANNWIIFDITNYITGEGDFSIGLSTPGSTAISLASKESGDFAPYIIVDLN
jgi:chitodextrinase